MSNFVFVPGAWHGGWCWKKVVPFLRAAGHETYTTSLTGLGERSHLLTPAVGLDTHVDDIVNLLEFEDLTNVVLVGHSYGGMVVSGVLGRAPARLRHLVYLDAVVPEPGQSLYDILPRLEPDGWKIPPPTGSPLFGVTDRADQEWIRSKLTPQPVRSFEQPLPSESLPSTGICRTYVLCTQKAETSPLRKLAARLRDATGWRYRELPTGHDAMVTMPCELAEILLEVS